MDDWKKFANENPDCLSNIAASSGSGESDFDRLSDILNAIPALSFVCLDVANGYSQHFVEYVRRVRGAFPNHTIIVNISIWVYININCSRCNFFCLI